MLDGEKTIIESAVKGESSAFGLLYDYYQPKIYRFVFFKVSHREEAEDITHQVFLHSWTHIDQYKHRGFPFSSWLYRIARNQVIDHYRSKKFTTSLEAVDRELVEISEISRMTDQGFAMEKVYRALQQLKDEQREVVLMRFVEELSLKETAAAIQKSEGAVKLIQHRALNNLRSILELDTSETKDI